MGREGVCYMLLTGIIKIHVNTWQAHYRENNLETRLIKYIFFLKFFQLQKVQMNASLKYYLFLVREVWNALILDSILRRNESSAPPSGYLFGGPWTVGLSQRKMLNLSSGNF